mmetsp:Transcript_4768/g.9663  ORF Transcript_4768/g.9663 Transcript_4768/m.9663 type:complete len:226 (+) Transcript_4768:1062-1739(+)
MRPQPRRALHHRGLSSSLRGRCSAPLQQVDQAVRGCPDEQLVGALGVEYACKSNPELLRAQLRVRGDIEDELGDGVVLQKWHQRPEVLAELQQVEDEAVQADAVMEHHQTQGKLATALQIHSLEINRCDSLGPQKVQPVGRLVEVAMVGDDPDLHRIAIGELVHPELGQLHALIPVRAVVPLPVALDDDRAASAEGGGADGLRALWEAAEAPLDGARAHASQPVQ